MKRIILLNGPPRSGKDTIGSILKMHEGFQIDKFAQPIRDWACMFFGINDADIERLKETEMIGSGRTLRQWMISYSEDFLKVNGGPRIFGNLLIDRIEQFPFVLYAITDSGFAEEGQTLVDRYGADNILLVHVLRPNHDFSGDSRSYIELPNVKTYEFRNDGPIFDLHRKVMHMLYHL
jgi:hypothetical protein